MKSLNQLLGALNTFRWQSTDNRNKFVDGPWTVSVEIKMHSMDKVLPLQAVLRVTNDDVLVMQWGAVDTAENAQIVDWLSEQKMRISNRQSEHEEQVKKQSLFLLENVQPTLL